MKNGEGVNSDFNHLCGQVLSVQFHPSGKRSLSCCFGFVPEKCLILQTPAAYNPRTDHREGDDVTVRYMDDGIVYGFRSEILSYVYAPVRLLFLSLPDDVEAMELRASRRVDTMIKAVLSKGSFHLSGVILNLSGGGCLLSLPREFDAVTGEEEILWDAVALAEKDRVALSFSIDSVGGGGPRKLKEVGGEVCRVEWEEGHVRLNLKFDGAQTEAIGQVEDYVTSVLRLLPT